MTTESRAGLEARIRGEIETAGPMTFARFMELALYDPEEGYYRQAQARAVREGDFLTAPEMHPIFGWTLAREIDRLWQAIDRPDPFRLIEYGAGSGSLALAIVERLRRDRSGLVDALEYEPIELNDHRRAELQARFEAAGLSGLLRLDERADERQRVSGFVLANEFLDALPVHRVKVVEGDLRELYVGLRGERLVDVPGPPSRPELAARLADDTVRLAEDQEAEICLELEPWLIGVERTVGRGFVLAIDYGFEAPELYGPRHMRGTLLGYARHRVITDPYGEIGRQDLTAHVDFTALRRLALGRGFADLGRAPQRDLLAAAGLAGILREIQADPATTLAEYSVVRASVVRLLDPRGTGAFRAQLLGRGVDPGLRLTGATAPASF